MRLEPALSGGSSPDKTTIFDVAQRAGVSIKTVSRVVNNEPNVRERTREKVMKAVAELQYRPNSAARGLSGKRSYVLGLIYENASEFSYMKHVLDGALDACDGTGYTLLLCPLKLPNPNALDRIRTFATQARVDGALLPAPIGDLEGVVELMRELEIPIATITPKQPADDAINVSCDDARTSQALTEFLIEQGHRRIGFIKGHPDHRASEERYVGYKKALKKHSIKLDSSLVHQGYFTFDSGRAATSKLLSLKDRPTAVMASNDDMAAGAAFTIREFGLTVPDDVSIVGYDDTPVAAHIWPPLTTARQPIEAMAEHAGQLLIRRLRGEEVESPESAFHCEVVIRQSTRAVS